LFYVTAGIILGIIAGLNFNVGYNPAYAVYISLSILALIDTIINIISENLNSEVNILKSGILLISDLAFALLLGYIGEQLGLPIYLAAIFAFGNNIYKNIRVITNFVIQKYNK